MERRKKGEKQKGHFYREGHEERKEKQNSEKIFCQRIKALIMRKKGEKQKGHFYREEREERQKQRNHEWTRINTNY